MVFFSVKDLCHTDFLLLRRNMKKVKGTRLGLPVRKSETNFYVNFFCTLFYQGKH